MSSLRRNILKVFSGTMLSRVLGFVREMLQARFIGAGVEQSAFTMAFLVPNLFRRLFGEGALTAAFLPIFKEAVEQKRWKEAQRLANAVFGMAALALGVLVALGFLAVGGVFACREVSGRMAYTLRLILTMLPYALFICGAAYGMGILNALNHWKAAAFTPCLLNVVWIAALCGMAFWPDLPVRSRVYLLGFAILAAGIVQLAFVLHRVRAAKKADGTGIVLRPSFRGWRDGATKRVVNKTIQGAIGAGATQICAAIDQLLAQVATPWAAGVIAFADRLMELPLGLFAVSFTTVLLPTLSGAFGRHAIEEAQETFLRALADLVKILLPAAVGIAVLANDLTRAVYEGRLFDETATVRVSRALLCYAPGILSISFTKILTQWFHAQQDIKRPMQINLALIFVNVLFNCLAVYLLPEDWRHVGIVGSTVLCSAITGLVLFLTARRDSIFPSFRPLAKPLGQTVVAAGLMGIVLLVVAPHLREVVPSFLPKGILANFWALGLQIGIGAGVYCAVQGGFWLLGHFKRGRS
ncbi:MAG: murein biosynthesis integral membrane protein MurJ [Kiritimatiellia bacterium]